MLRFIKFCSLGLLFLVALVLINALTHNPENEKFLNKLTFEINEERAITNLSNSIKFETISNQNRSEESLEEFERFIDWLKKVISWFIKIPRSKYLMTLFCSNGKDLIHSSSLF